MILDLRFQIFDLPDLFDLSLSIGNYWIGTSIRNENASTFRKLAIASATRKPGSSNPSGYQLEFILHLAKVWYNGSFRIIEKCEI